MTDFTKIKCDKTLEESNVENITPLMKQYNKIKERFKDFILLFRLGDFYEMWNEDAQFCSSKLGILLTKRGQNPMCGIPHHTSEMYIKKLINDFNVKVAICEQVESPEDAQKDGRKLVNRDVVKIISKGTFCDKDSVENSFLLSFYKNEDNFFFTYCDISTGECFAEKENRDLILSSLHILQPKEILINRKQEEDFTFIIESFEDIITFVDFQESKETEPSLYFLMEYLKKNGCPIEINLSIKNKGFITDQWTFDNLEIFNSNRGEKNYSLMKILDKTSTSMGKRILRSVLERPLVKKDDIEKRLDAVEFFKNLLLSNKNLEIISYDLNKLCTNLKSNIDLYKIAVSIEKFFNFSSKFLENSSKEPEIIFKMRNNLNKITCQKDIMSLVNDQGEVLESAQMKELKEKEQKIMSEISNLPTKMGINGKVKENTLIGFFLECNKNLTLDDRFFIKQGLVNVTRYSSVFLVRLETEIGIIRKKITEHCNEVFKNLCSIVNEQKNEILELAKIIGWIDFFISCAKISIEKNYFRPQFLDKNITKILDGRHPFLDKFNFVKNSLEMDEKNRIFLITGPNMGGKSTFLKQNAIIIIMAQCGMFVPAKMASKVFDGVFIRAGAHDNIKENQSTFMIEMKQCGEILKLSSENSFICFDEIGRGTSTKDGMSISFAILENIHDIKRSFSLVSTHYNELSVASEYLTAIKNKRIKVAIHNNEVVLLHFLEDGVAESSFGIEITQKVLEKSISNRSREIFDSMQISLKIKHF